MKNGVGKWTSPNGDYYQGTWVNNKQEGEGIHFHKGTGSMIFRKYLPGSIL